MMIHHRCQFDEQQIVRIGRQERKGCQDLRGSDRLR
jgi:hypothetical protein